MKAHRRRRVFVVDGSSVVRERLVTMLSEWPELEVAGESARATEAVTAIEKVKPDAVVLDVTMPDASGMDVLIAIKRQPSPPVVIMLTNLPQDGYRRKCLALGADHFFDKSTEFYKVVDVLRKRPKARKATVTNTPRPSGPALGSPAP